MVIGEFVDPLHRFSSSNELVNMKHPYIQYVLGALFNVGVIRSKVKKADEIENGVLS